MLLIDTAPLMISDDYRDRFKAEYYQTKIRRDKLKDMVDNWDDLNFVPTCEKSVYVNQLKAMDLYLDILIFRAEKEQITL